MQLLYTCRPLSSYPEKDLQIWRELGVMPEGVEVGPPSEEEAPKIDLAPLVYLRRYALWLAQNGKPPKDGAPFPEVMQFMMRAIRRSEGTPYDHLILGDMWLPWDFEKVVPAGRYPRTLGSAVRVERELEDLSPSLGLSANSGSSLESAGQFTGAEFSLEKQSFMRLRYLILRAKEQPGVVDFGS